VDKVPVDQLMGPAAVIDVSELLGDAGDGDSPRISVEAVRRGKAGTETSPPASARLPLAAAGV
jgi:hypothetical protein